MNERKLASIQRIVGLAPIPNADAIECATVLGWHVVVKKGEFNVGDLVVYTEIDSLLPLRPEFDFLAKGGTKKMMIDGQAIEGYRIRTARLRGQISQGIVFPLSVISGEVREGRDVTEELGIYKYEIPIPTQLAGKVRGGFPGFIPKTDETRLQAFPAILERYQGIPFFVTEKLDGSSTSFCIKSDEFHVCSRSLDLLDDGVNTIWQTAKTMHIEQKMREAGLTEKVAIQGEIVGPKIQSNRLGLSGYTIFFFNAYNFAEGRYLNYDEYRALFTSLDLPTVPLIASGLHLPVSVDELVTFATRRSLICPAAWAEGCVFRPLDEMRDEDLGRLSFKVINPEFLLKHGE